MIAAARPGFGACSLDEDGAEQQIERQADDLEAPRRVLPPVYGTLDGHDKVSPLGDRRRLPESGCSHIQRAPRTRPHSVHVIRDGPATRLRPEPGEPIQGRGA